jgi:hypothetical protein
MAVMSIAEAWPAAGRPFTVADLDRMPDDRHRYELLDGALVVSPRPTNPHQEVAMELPRGRGCRCGRRAAGSQGESVGRGAPGPSGKTTSRGPRRRRRR